MSKKIFMLFLMLVLISVSAVSAAEWDGNNDTIVSSADAEALAIENDVNAIDDLSENVADGGDEALANDSASVAVGKNNEILQNPNSDDVLGFALETYSFPEEITVGKEFSFSYLLKDSSSYMVNLKFADDNPVWILKSNFEILTYTYNGGLRGSNSVLLYFENNDGEFTYVDLQVTINDPVLPTDTWYVNASAAHGGDGKSPDSAFRTLKDALTNNKLQEGNTIMIASGTYTGENNTGLDINNTLSFEKYGDGEAIIDAEGLNRIWTVTAATININGLTFKNGKSSSDHGGAIYIQNPLSDSTINATFINNTANSRGGAVYFNKEINNVNIYGEFINNLAYDWNPLGGALYIAKFSNSNIDAKFINNSAGNSAGAIYISGGSNSNVMGEFRDNNAPRGGAIYFGTISDFNINAVFINNTASVDGGAICFSRNLVNVNMTGDFINNTAEGSGSENGGGAIAFYNPVTNSAISGNFIGNKALGSADTDGGAAFFFFESMTNVDISGKYMNNTGNNVIYIIGKNADTGNMIHDSTFLNNDVSKIFKVDSGNFTAIDNWFGNNATNYDQMPADVGIDLDNWLFLNATADPNEIRFGESATVAFKLYNKNSPDVEYDASKMNIVLDLAKTIGELDKNAASLGEEINYTAKEVGDASVTATFETVSYTLSLKNNKGSASISIENDTMALKVYDEIYSGAALTPADAGNLTYTSSNESVVIVENGMIKAIGEGTAIITVSFEGNDFYAAAENRTITVNVGLNDASVGVNNSTLDLSVGDNFTIVAATVPDGLNVTFVSDNSGVVSVDENGVVTALKGGAASIIVKVGGDGVYAENSTVVNITVNKLSAEIVIVNDTLNVTVLNFTSAGASLDPAGAGDLTYTSSNESVVIVENGMIKAIGEGTAIITVSFEGNDFYAAAENRTITVNVGLNDASVSVNNSTLDLFVGDNFTIVAATVPEGLAVSFSSSNESVATVDADGKIVAVGIGSAIITVSVGGEGIYALNSTTVAVNIVKKDLNISAYTFTMSGNVTLIIVGFENATGNVTVTVGENNYNSSIMMGMAFVSIPKSDENVTAYVYYPGDDNYCNASTSVVIVAKKDLNITITADPICIGQNATVIVSGLENATGNVTVIAGRSFSNATIINGTATAIISGLNKTTMVIVFYMGDNTYNMAFASVNITVKENLTISASANPIFVGENATVVITGLKNATENVSVRAGGKIYFAAIVNGTAKVVIPALSESIIGYVDYAGDENYTASNTTVQITVNKINTKISANAITATYNVNKNLVITLKDAKGNALGRVSITVNLNGVKTYTTNNNGQIKINVAKLVPKAYTAKITFAGNNKYAASSANVKVTVKKAKSTITAKKKTFKKAKKTKKYSITLKSGKTAIKKVQVTLKIKGKTYKAKTNNKGKATFKIKKLTKKGTFKATIKFKGNKYYKSVAKKVKIKIK